MSSSSDRRLYTLKPSPWSERARWVLDHHGLAHQQIEHVPFLGERRLRRVLGRPEGRVTVPVLLSGDQVLGDSWEIARYGDRAGRGEKLLPEELEGDIRRWHELAEGQHGCGARAHRGQPARERPLQLSWLPRAPSSSR